MPLNLEVIADEETKVLIPIVRSAMVKGKVDMKKVDAIQSSKEKLTMPRIIIEITNGEETLLTRADGNGNFIFGSLRSGTWSIRMISGYWKDQFHIRKGQFDLELTSDTTTQVNFLIEPKVRSIKFLNPTTIKIGEE